jgi:hypothetical protein
MCYYVMIVTVMWSLLLLYRPEIRIQQAANYFFLSSHISHNNQQHHHCHINKLQNAGNKQVHGVKLSNNLTMRLATTFNTRTAWTLVLVLVLLALNILIISDMSPANLRTEQTTEFRETRPMVALLTPISAQNSHWNVSHSALATIMLPSLTKNLNCEYRYVVVVGYKRGDVYYDTSPVRRV